MFFLSAKAWLLLCDTVFARALQIAPLMSGHFFRLSGPRIVQQSALEGKLQRKSAHQDPWNMCERPVFLQDDGYKKLQHRQQQEQNQ